MNRFAATVAGLLFSAHSPAAEDVGFRLAKKELVIVPVLVNGQGPYEFLLDTGSTTSVVHRSLARDLGLKPLGHTVMRTVSGTERVPIARLHRIGLGAQAIRTVLVLCSEMDGARGLDGKLRGILGFNFLSRLRYTLDYREKRLRFGPEVRVEGTRLPFDGDSRSIVLVAAGMRLLLDTGATNVFLFAPEGIDVETNPRSLRRVSANNGQRVARSGFLRRLDIGDVSFHRLSVTLVPDTALAGRADGLLPGKLFDAIYFDHENNFVILNPVRW